MIAHKLIAACNAGWLQIAPERDQKPPQYGGKITRKHQ
jgi:hypothetical protein